MTKFSQWNVKGCRFTWSDLRVFRSLNADPHAENKEIYLGCGKQLVQIHPWSIKKLKLKQQRFCHLNKKKKGRVVCVWGGRGEGRVFLSKVSSFRCRGWSELYLTNWCNGYMYIVLQTFRAIFLNAVYFRWSLTCTLGLTNELIDGISQYEIT